VEHVVSYPGDYSPAFAFSAIRYPLAIRASCDALTWPIRPGVQRVYRVPRRWHGGEGVVYLPAVLRQCVWKQMSQTSRPRAILAQAY